MNYSSPYNDGYTRKHYRDELLRLKVMVRNHLSIINGTLDETEDTSI